MMLLFFKLKISIDKFNVEKYICFLLIGHAYLTPLKDTPTSPLRSPLIEQSGLNLN